MTFDVAIPTYKRPLLAKQAVLSCLSQGTLLNKVILVDDGSGDETPEIINAIGDARILYYQRPANGGMTAARRDAFALSNAEWTVSLDSDHELLHGALEKFEALAQRAGAGVDILGGRYLWDTGVITPINIPAGLVGYKDRIELSSLPDNIGTDYLCAVSRRIRQIAVHEPLRSNIPEILIQLDLAKAGNALFTGDTLAFQKSATEESWSRGSAEARWARRCQDASDGVTCLHLLLKRHGNSMEQWGRPMLSGLLAIGAFYALLSGRRRLAWRWATQSLYYGFSRVALSGFGISLLPLSLVHRLYLYRG